MVRHDGVCRACAGNRRAEQRTRRFRPAGNLDLSGKTCFVLTESGQLHARRTCAAADRCLPGLDGKNLADPTDVLAQSAPCWNSRTRELRLGNRLIKKFRVPAGNQERILDAFQEEGWPPQIDDPLPPVRELDSKHRLHDTINRLNRHQQQSLVRFRGDGRGQGVRFELLIRTATRLPPDRR